jgi:hypothetical protein
MDFAQSRDSCNTRGLCLLGLQSWPDIAGSKRHVVIRCEIPHRLEAALNCSPS